MPLFTLVKTGNDNDNRHTPVDFIIETVQEVRSAKYALPKESTATPVGVTKHIFVPVPYCGHDVAPPNRFVMYADVD